MNANQRKSVEIGSSSSKVLGPLMFICDHLRWFADKSSVKIRFARCYR